MERQVRVQSETISTALSALGYFKDVSEGAIAVDVDGRITWINQKYVSLLAAQGERPEIGRHIEDVIPESRLPHVAQTGEPILLDIMRVGERNFVVCRLPLHDKAGQICGAVGFVFYNDVARLSPLLEKYQNLEQELAMMRRARFSLSGYLGTSEAVQTLRRRARLVAKRESPVLISGETGVGKELLAHGIHLASEHSEGPFVAINVASMVDDRIEEAFFGQLELADGGTLFLDEVGNMPFPVQAKLLRVLEDGVIESVGSRTLSSVTVRIIATTSANLEQKVKEGSFRSDLYYRLAVLPLSVPPLRTRPEDIDILVDLVLDRLSGETGGFVVSDEGMLLLKSQLWPGNVRELQNVLERASLETEGGAIDSRDIAAALQLPFHETAADGAGSFVIPLSESLRRAEKSAIIDALLRSKGNREETARILGISRSSLYGKLKSLGVDDM